MLINRIDIRIKTGKEYIAIVAIFAKAAAQSVCAI